MPTSGDLTEPGAGAGSMRDPVRFAALLRIGGQDQPEVTYSVRQCRCGAEMRRSRQGPHRWCCERCGRHERH